MGNYLSAPFPEESRKPRLFIGCAASDLRIAKAIEQNLWREVEVTVWNEDNFDSTHGPLETLVTLSESCDFAILVVSPLDPSRHDGFKSVRDNVVFELGLFLGALGRDRVFVVGPHSAKDLKLPSDMAGLEPLPYELGRIDGKLQSALAPACTSILDRITALRSSAKNHPDKEPKHVPPSSPTKAPSGPILESEKRQRLANAGIEIDGKSAIGIPNVASTDFFHSDRFSKAFPGVRDVEWFYDNNAIIARLVRLLKSPLKFYDVAQSGDVSGWLPIWWWRGLSNNAIESFELLSDGKVLLNHQELIPFRLAAVNRGSYYQSFVYVECAADQPTGLYARSHEEVDQQRKERGYCREEFAMFGDRLIHRTEYDDGAAIIDGKPVELHDDAKLRVRYLTPYNFLIAAHESPINSKHFDRDSEHFMNDLLCGRDTFDKLVEKILELPRRERFPI